MYSYILLVVSMASGQPAIVSTHEFRDLGSCETAKEYVLKVDAKRTGLVWREQFIEARCVLSQGSVK